MSMTRQGLKDKITKLVAENEHHLVIINVLKTKLDIANETIATQLIGG